MVLDDLGPAERFAAGAVGRPGRRTFYIEVTAEGIMHSLVLEKGQVDALARQGLGILASAGVTVDESAVQDLVDSGLGVVEPPEPRFRVGSISMGVGPADLVTLTIESAEEDDGVVFFVAPEQFLAMARVALKAVESGRPVCRWCRLPMDDTDDHACPARN